LNNLQHNERTGYQVNKPKDARFVTRLSTRLQRRRANNSCMVSKHSLNLAKISAYVA
jgi:hypothetical protein